MLQEESLKVEADAVLSDVTYKKSEARRQLAMLSALEKLRQLRTQVASTRGEHVSLELSECFSSVIGRACDIFIILLVVILVKKIILIQTIISC